MTLFSCVQNNFRTQLFSLLSIFYHFIFTANETFGSCSISHVLNNVDSKHSTSSFIKQKWTSYFSNFAFNQETLIHLLSYKKPITLDSFFKIVPILQKSQKYYQFLKILFRFEALASMGIIMIEQVASNKSSLLLKIVLQNAQTLQLFTINIKTEIIYKMPSRHAWVESSIVLLKEGWSASA